MMWGPHKIGDQEIEPTNVTLGSDSEPVIRTHTARSPISADEFCIVKIPGDIEIQQKSGVLPYNMVQL